MWMHRILQEQTIAKRALIKDHFTWCPKSYVPVYLKLICVVLAVESMGTWDLSIHMGSQVRRLRYDVNVHMTILFGGEARNLC